MSFINWGDETPEQKEIRKKLEEHDSHQLMLRKVFEARSGVSSASASGAGSGGPATPSFTITPTSFTGVSPWDTITPVEQGDTYGFEVAESENLIMAYEGTGVSQELEDSIMAIHPSSGSTGYVYNVVWAEGSAVSSGLAKFAYYSNLNKFRVLPIDPSDPDWMLNDDTAGTPLGGTFLFPAKFTLYTPVIDKNSWC